MSEPLDVRAVTRVEKIVFALEGGNAARDLPLIEQVVSDPSLIRDHPRFYRSWSFGDDDFPYCAVEVFSELYRRDPANLDRAEQVLGLAAVSNAPRGHGTEIRPFRLFISHRATEREKAHALKAAVYGYNITGFVAHDDIAPTAAWQSEIENWLQRCDALVYLSSPASNDSAWCQQELGWAMGRRIPVIALDYGADPIGFVGSRQAVRGLRDDQARASRLLRLLMQDGRTAEQMAAALIDGLQRSGSVAQAQLWYPLLAEAPSLGAAHMRGIEDAVANNRFVAAGFDGRLPGMLRQLGSREFADGA